jgi:hypothetical protein
MSSDSSVVTNRRQDTAADKVRDAQFFRSAVTWYRSA